jgi:hypothetical protein
VTFADDASTVDPVMRAIATAIDQKQKESDEEFHREKMKIQ